MDNFNLKKYLVENKRTSNSKVLSEAQDQLRTDAPYTTAPINEVTYSKREIITSVTFSNGEKFEVGEYSNYDDMRVTAIRPVPENEREEDEVVSIEMKGSDGKATYYFNENGEQVEE